MLYTVESSRGEQSLIFESMQKFVENARENLTLYQFEKEMFKLALQLGRSMLKEFLARQGDGAVAEGFVQNAEGKSLPAHSIKRCNYLSIFGQVQIERMYYWCAGQSGICPLDQRLDLPDRLYSYLLQQWLVSKVADDPFDWALDDIETLFELSIPKRSLESVVTEVSQNAEQYYQQKTIDDPGGEVICVSADGKGVRMVPREKPTKSKAKKKSSGFSNRAKGERGLKREAVVTCDYSFDPQPRSIPEVLEHLMKAISQQHREPEAKKSVNQKERLPLNKRVFASLGSKKAAFISLCDRVRQQDPDETKPIYILLDGDPYLERDLLDAIKQQGWEHRLLGVCLDIIHVSEYLWECGTALKGEKGPREPWIRKQLERILSGKVDTVIDSLRRTLKNGTNQLKQSQKAKLAKAIQYFSNHRHMMRYHEFLSKGYSIATGVIEGACGNLVKDRMEGSGMRWTINGAQAVLNIRAIKKNGDLDDYWQKHMSNEAKRFMSRAA